VRGTDGGFAAGAELIRIQDDWHEPVKVFSLYLTDEKATKQAIVQVINQVIAELPTGTTELKVRSSMKHFAEKKWLQKEFNSQHGLKVLFMRKKPENLSPNIDMLAADAVERKQNIIVEV